jgi:hypothetical protein
MIVEAESLADRSPPAGSIGRARSTDRVGARWRRAWPSGSAVAQADAQIHLALRWPRAVAVRSGSSDRWRAHLSRNGRFARCCALRARAGAVLGLDNENRAMPMSTATGAPNAALASQALRITRSTRSQPCQAQDSSARPRQAGMTMGGANRLLAPPQPYLLGIRGPDGCTIATQSQVLPTCGLADQGADKLPCRQIDDFARATSVAGNLG